MKNEIDMGSMKISKLAWKVSLPMVISMISIALYTILDTLFISKINGRALTAISIVYPIQNIITSIALGLGIGINSLLANNLGKNDKEKTKNIIVLGIQLIIVTWFAIALIFLFFSKSFLMYFTKEQELLKLGSSYLKITSVFSFGLFLQIGFEKILEAHGKTKESMIIQLLGAVINLILDPILIFGVSNFKGWGIEGAAIATVIGQLSGMIYGIYLIKKFEYITMSDFKILGFDKKIFKDIYRVGLPTTLLEIASSVIMIIINKILIKIDNLSIDAWGIYVKVQKFIFIIVYGFNYGMIPILAYNIGARNIDRAKDTLKYFMKIAITVTAIGMIIFIFLPKPIINCFNVSDITCEIAIKAFRISAIGFIFAGINLVLSASFQSFGNAKNSLIINLSRKIIFVLPIIFSLKNVMVRYCVWWAFTLSEIITVVIAIFLFYKEFKNIKNKIENGN